MKELVRAMDPSTELMEEGLGLAEEEVALARESPVSPAPQEKEHSLDQLLKEIAEAAAQDGEPVEAEAEPEVDTTAAVPERPAKRARMMRVAERLGYAALGGVTAGAMIVGTLIYTAPTFG
jgi:hypothetical protein